MGSHRTRRRSTRQSPPRLRFASARLPGLALVMDGLRFDLLAIDAHERLDGRETRLARWASTCADCGAAFTSRSPALRLSEVKRCPLHRSPGRKVAQ